MNLWIGQTYKRGTAGYKKEKWKMHRFSKTEELKKVNFQKNILENPRSNKEEMYYEEQYILR